MLKKIVGTAVLVCISAMGAEGPRNEGKKTKWWLSILALGGASAFDAASSWGRPELNPALRGGNGSFGGRAIAIKGSIVAGTVLVQALVVRHHPQAANTLAWGNFIGAAGYTAVAARNSSLAHATPATPAAVPAGTALLRVTPGLQTR